MTETTTIKIAIIDDEAHNIEELIAYLDQFKFKFELIGTADSIKEGETLLLTHSPDLVFLDMKLPDGEGIQLLEKIGRFSFHLIFFTAHSNYALQAFEYGSVDYLLKPIELKALSRALKKFLKEFTVTKKTQTEQKIAIPHKQGTLFIATKELIYIQAYGEYCYVVTDTKRILLAKTLKDVEKVVQHHGFIRVHRSYLVNLNKINFFQQKGKASITLSNGEQVEVSRRKKEEVVKAIENKVVSI